MEYVGNEKLKKLNPKKKQFPKIFVTIALILESKNPDSVIVRIPEIPGLVNKKQQEETKRELMDLGVKRFNLFRYRESNVELDER